MADEIKTTEHTPTAEPTTPAPVHVSTPVAPARQGFDGNRRGGSGGGRGGQRGGGGNRRGGGGREERAKPEFDQKMLGVRRVARVVAGGRRFNFSVLMVIGNRKGSVGVGTGKAGDTALAIEKATKNAKKHMLKLTRTANNSIPHIIEAKYSSASIVILPAKNKGLIAGSAVRSVLELAGITDVNAKIRSGSKNKLNIAQATIKALSGLTNNRQLTTDNKKTEEKPAVISG
ncbi:MAG: 30S ribosomal protein S5 [Candidatus Taylorbacteria bacterium]|nr:30S ribosomal protein S5 [Candidatus Taylorbacteria bacterium]